MKQWLGLLAVAAVCTACGGSDPAAADAPAAAAGAEAAAAADAAPGVAESAVATTAGAPARPATQPPAAPAFREIVIPEGTALRLDLATALASDSSQVEDAVRATLRQPLAINGVEVLPAGTELTGIVTDVAGSGRVKGRARLAYRFSSLRHEGERYDIDTAAIAHEAEATKSEDATKIAIGAGAGAALGALLGGGDGAAKGAAIGGAGGTGVVLATKGEEVRLGPGADVTTRLTAPLTIRVQR